MAQPFLRVHREYPEAKMPVEEIAFYSPPPRAFLAASSESLVWGDATARWRDGLRAPVEQTLFPGVATLLLALLGLGSRAYPSGLRMRPGRGHGRLRRLSLGLPSATRPERGYTPYRLLFDVAPGWDGVRTPGRINTLTSLGLALLAGGGGRARPPPRAAALPGESRAAAACSSLLILVEGFGPMPRARRPRPRRGLSLPRLLRSCTCRAPTRSTASTATGRPTATRSS